MPSIVIPPQWWEDGRMESILLYLDQNYLSGMVKRKPAFRELEPVLREAIARGAVEVPESEAHRVESAARPDLPLLALLRELSGGLRLPDQQGRAERGIERRLRWAIENELPERQTRPSDEIDLRTLSLALPRCALVTCDAFMADVMRRTRLDRWHGCEVYSGRREDVRLLTARLATLR
jgi:hypothetical protein